MVKIESSGENKEGEEKKKYFPELYRAMSTGLAMLAFSLPMDNSTKAENREKISNSGKNNPETQMQRDWSDMHIKTAEKFRSGEIQWPEAGCTFFEGVDENGNPKFNIWSLVAILQTEFSYLEKKDGKMTFQIPFEYARLFAGDGKAGKPMNPDHFPAMERYIDRDLKKKFAEILYGWDWNKKVYNNSREKAPEGLEIKSIEITGTASPEGSSPESIKPGKIDRENLDLALMRGRTALFLSKEWLARSGVDLKKIEEAASRIKAKEIQFSKIELFELKTLAAEMPGSDDMEKIYNLIKRYNEESVEDRSSKRLLEEMLLSKRMVEITIHYEGSRSRRVLIPIPLLPIIISISIPWLIRKRETRKRVLSIAPTVKNTDLPPENSAEYQDIRERTIIDDLGTFFDAKDTVRRGLDYRKITDDVQRRYDYFTNDGARLQYLTNEILKAWRIHDKKCRQEAGLASADLESGLDYESQPYQIKWAKMHAVVLLELIEENRGNKDDYRNILSGKISELLKNKGER
ncbi:MAG: hypothetical protein WC858_03410 [Parcubacteria group bacterium]|jgi:hypothetical protein